MLEKREKEKQYEQRLETFSRSNMQAYWPEMLFSLTFIHKCMRVSVLCIIANIKYNIFIIANLIDEKYPIISIFNLLFTSEPKKKGNLYFYFLHYNIFS